VPAGLGCLQTGQINHRSFGGCGEGVFFPSSELEFDITKCHFLELNWVSHINSCELTLFFFWFNTDNILQELICKEAKENPGDVEFDFP